MKRDRTNPMGLYVLDGHTPVPCLDTLVWASWMERADRHVALTRVGPLTVSTVFLGLDHNHMRQGRPVLFETMAWIDRPHEIKIDKYVFKEETDFVDFLNRCCTWDEAEAMHENAIKELAEPGDKREELKHTESARGMKRVR